MIFSKIFLYYLLIIDIINLIVYNCAIRKEVQNGTKRKNQGSTR